MKNSDYSVLLQIAYPEARWSLFDVTDFGTLSWDPSNTISKPSLEELATAFEHGKAYVAMQLLRIKRDQLLKGTDVYALPDFPHASKEQRQAWLDYRQQLRDLPMKSTPMLKGDMTLDDASVSFPTKPK